MRSAVPDAAFIVRSQPAFLNEKFEQNRCLHRASSFGKIPRRTQCPLRRIMAKSSMFRRRNPFRRQFGQILQINPHHIRNQRFRSLGFRQQTVQKAAHLRRPPFFSQLQQNPHRRLDLIKLQQRQRKHHAFRRRPGFNQMQAPFRQRAYFSRFMPNKFRCRFLAKAGFLFQPRRKFSDFRIACQKRCRLKFGKPVQSVVRRQPGQNRIVQPDALRRKAVSRCLTQIAEQIVFFGFA